MNVKKMFHDDNLEVSCHSDLQVFKSGVTQILIYYSQILQAMLYYARQTKAITYMPMNSKYCLKSILPVVKFYVS